MENRNSLEDTVDRLLSKYVSVWLWSILFGTDVGLTYSSITYYSPNKWGSLGFLLVILLVLTLLASLMSWLNLLKYLSGYLIPRFFTEQEIRYSRDVYAGALIRALRFMIIAFLARGSMTVIDLLYTSFFRF